MKILYYSRGLTVHDQRFLTALAESEHQAYFLRLETPSASEQQSSLPDGVGEPAAPGTDLQQVIDAVQPDIVHAGPLHTGGALAAQSGFHPLVLMSWGSDILYEAEHDPEKKAAISRALEATDVLIADCLAVRDKAREYGFPADQIVVFPWGVDLERFSPTGGDGGLRARLGWQDAFVLLHLRAWEPLYGVETLAHAFVLAAKRNERLRLLLPGAGSLGQILTDIFEQGGVQDHVHVPGPLSQSDLPAYYRATDLYLSASRSDGSSVSLMEALACGLPALVSDIPCNREWVSHEQEGWLFPVDAVGALAAAILRVATDPAQLQPIRGHARRKAEAKANWTTNQTGLFAAYDLARSRHA